MTLNLIFVIKFRRILLLVLKGKAVLDFHTQHALHVEFEMQVSSDTIYRSNTSGEYQKKEVPKTKSPFTCLGKENSLLFRTACFFKFASFRKQACEESCVR